MNDHPSPETLSAWIDDELDPKGRHGVEAHLETCEACRETLADLREVLSLARRPPRPWDRREAAWEGLRDRLPARGGPAPPAASRPRRAALVLLAAAAAVAALLWAPPLFERSRSAEGVMATLDQETRAVLEEDAVGDSELSPALRAVYASAAREVSRGVEELQRALEERPTDPVLHELLRRALEQRADLVRGMSR